jgi:hypothetical protein
MSGFELVQNPDGAGFQSQSVLAYLRYFIRDGIEGSWDNEWKRYRADIRVCRYDNCREQGYVVWLRSLDYKHQINIAFYEHRNSDDICAVVSDVQTFNAPLLADILVAMEDKYDTAISVSVGRADEMAEWISGKLRDFWAIHHPRETVIAA